MQPITSQKLCEILGCKGPVADAVIHAVSTDSRKVQPGDLFIAVKGEKFDAHDFVPEVIAKGAALAVVEHPVEGVAAEKQMVVPKALRA